MKHLTSLIGGALLVIGLANVVPTPAAAAGGTYYDSVCNCRRPDSEYNTKRVLRAATPRVNTRVRYVDHTREVKRTRLIQENRLVVHVQPVINREVVVHRQNTVVRNITLHKVNTTNRTEVVNRNETVNRYVQGGTRVINERREVRGVNCNCGPDGGARYSGGGYEGQRVSYRE
ncbi:hypothetical protein ASD45_04110 [Pseudolabrys sp. Root1462]|uniref:hypothetical protein n=1 Tax=Pseudolabrys sp. Root1462 TaxID=1736466 RepID=UPI000703853F|nr:hypothetical protein [Pseudolabrys sp. Root1462]KQZ00125.1 hypothetical protein ASD45_04110 [Pseudolabrys sp. Root1462]